MHCASTKEKTPRSAALILTGGSGERVQGLDYPKQFYAIKGNPLFIYSLEVYEQMDTINDIYLVINPDYTEKYQDILKKYKFSKLRKLVDGGTTRQDSIANGLAVIDKADIVVLQDGANPTTRAHFISVCIDVADQNGAATGCVAPRDTVVQVKGNEVDAVLERESLAYTCTPQVYRFELIQKAFLKAKDDNLTNRPTVDLVKRIGQKVVLVPCSHETVKITRFEDFYLAEQILQCNEEFK